MGYAVPLRAEPAPKMITVYCVQSFWRDRQKLAKGRFQQFKTERQAVAAAVMAANRSAGVMVFSVTGNPEADYWSEPKLIVKHGDVPGMD